MLKAGVTDPSQSSAPPRKGRASANSFLKHAAVYGAGGMLLQAAGFILLPVYTRYLTPESFGTLEVAGRLAEILMIFLMTPGIRMATFTFFKQSESDAARRCVISSAVALVTVLVVAAGIVSIGCAGWISARLGINDPGVLRLVLLANLLEGLTLVPLIASQARLESTYFVAVMSTQFLVKVGLSLLFVAVLGWGIIGVAAASAITSGVFGIGLVWRELSRGFAAPDARLVREMVAFSLPFVLGGFGHFLLHDGDRFFLLKYAGGAAVGIYALGYKLAKLVGMFTHEPLQRVWSAQMYDVAREADAACAFGRAFTRIQAAYVAVGLGLCLFQEEFTALLGGSQYAGGARVVAPIVLAYGLSTAADMMDAAFYIRRRTGLKSWITVFSTAAMLALYAVLIPPLGIMGAAYATLAGFAFHLGLTWVVSQRVFRVRYEPERLAAVLGLAVLLWLASRLLPHAPWAIGVKLFLWLLWPAALWVGFVSKEEKAWVSDAVQSARARLTILISPGIAGEAP
jgi:O-antigen/teichoic acid export membrane protein